MTDGILDTVKSSLGVELTYTGFDVDILLGINSAIMALTQLGVGPPEGFIVIDTTEVWSDFLNTDINVEAAKSYITLKTRLSFDPPSSSFLIEAITNQINELGWRLVVQTEPTTP